VNYYQELGVSPEATNEEIRSAFRRKAKQAHPDRSGGSTDRMTRLNRAKTVLSDPQKRVAYDRTGQEDGPSAPDLARQALLALIMAWMDSETNSGNMIADVAETIARNRVELTKQMNAGTALVSRLKKRRGQIKFRGKGPDFAKIAIDIRVKDIEQNVERLRDQTGICDQARKLLDAYEYEAETPFATQFVTVNMGWR
jgi:DnaJ-class molecular chaperone